MDRSHCEALKTCEVCGETEGDVLAHQWVDATYEQARHCAECGTVSGKSLAFPLIWCNILEDSNEPGTAGKDVQTGSFKDCQGTVHTEALKFWTANMNGWANQEYIVFDLSDGFELMEFSIAAGADNQQGGKSQILIYGDGELIYQSDSVGNHTSVLEDSIDVSGVKSLRVVCTTDSPVFCYCILRAVLYAQS